MGKNILVVAAHIGDFVWRCGGTIAKCAKNGDDVHLIVLTYGIRGETNEYWKQPGGTAEACKAIRHAEGTRAAAILGVRTVDILDFEDYPLVLDVARVEQLAAKVRQIAPDIILTHDDARDPYNADHTLLGRKIHEICAVAAAVGANLDGLPPVKRPKVYGFEPHVPEVSGFAPRVYVDITDVQALKEQAMQAYATQSNMLAQYVNRARIRAGHSKIKGCAFAEAFAHHGTFPALF